MIASLTHILPPARARPTALVLVRVASRALPVRHVTPRITRAVMTFAWGARIMIARESCTRHNRARDARH